MEPVRSEHLVAVLPAGHPLAGPGLGGPLDLRALAEEGFVLFPPAQGSGLYGQIMEACRQAGFTPRVVQEAVQMDTILALVAGSAGVALAPRSVRAVARPGIICRPLRSSPVLQIAAAWRQGDDRAILQRALESVRQLRQPAGEELSR